jgi:hypothetical protein
VLRSSTSHSISSPFQSVALRLNPAFESFLERVLGEIIAMNIQDEIQTAKLDPIVFRGYLRVPVQDSTIIKLPAALFGFFSGVSNAHSTVCNTRIRAVYDLISGRLIFFSIDSCSKNDLAAAPGLPRNWKDLHGVFFSGSNFSISAATCTAIF